MSEGRDSGVGLAGGGLEDIPLRAAEAAAALEALREPAEQAAASIEAAFGRAGESLARSLVRAAADGEVTLAELARAVLAAANAGLGTALGAARGPGSGSGGGGGGLGAAVAAAVGGLFAGSRADGGPVLSGGSYLVGERGPEVFRPASAGTIEPQVGAGQIGMGQALVVNFNVPGGAPDLLRSEAQIAQMLARAVSLGARRL